VINRFDEFFESKFKKEMIKFPYFTSILADAKRNITIIALVSWSKFFGDNAKDSYYPPAMRVIMDINMKLRINLFERNHEAVELFNALILEFRKYAEENDFTPVFLLMPQKDDILYTRVNKKSYYEAFMRHISEQIMAIDLTADLINRADLDELYSDDSRYGGHFSKKGNRLIADIIYSSLKGKRIITGNTEEAEQQSANR
jgi:hypothetical protein